MNQLRRLKLLLAVVVAILLVSCAPGLTPPGPDATPEEVAAYEAALEEQRLRQIWSQTVQGEVVCTDQNGFVSDYLYTGANICGLTIEPPTGAEDFQTGEYTVRLHYLVPVGTFLAPEWEDRYQEFSGELDAAGESYVVTSFPWFVPETDPLALLWNVVASAFDAAIANAGALAFALGVPNSELLLGGQGVDFESIGGLFGSVGVFTESLIGSGNRPYYAEVIVRACGEVFCTDYGSVILEVRR